MTTYVDYIYRAPGSSEDVEIQSEHWPKIESAADVLPMIKSVGDVTPVRPDNQEEYGEERYFKVLEIKVAAPNLVKVIVTDPD